MLELLPCGLMIVCYVMMIACCVNGSKAENKLESALFGCLERFYMALLATILLGFIIM